MTKTLILCLLVMTSISSELYSQNLPGTTSDSTTVYMNLNDLNGVPSNFKVNNAYRETKSVFFILPTDEIDTNYSSVDKAFMSSYETDERYYFGSNPSDSSIYVKEVMSADQFGKTQLPYTHSLKYNGSVRHYGLNDSIIMTLSTDSLKSPSRGEGGSIDTNDISYISDYRIKYETQYQTIILDSIERTVFIELRDSAGTWIRRTFEQYGLNDTTKLIPIASITKIRAELPSDKCVFKVKQIVRGEIYTSSISQSSNQSASLPSTSTSNNKLITDLRLFPNPSSTILNIVIPEDLEGNISARIINMRGDVFSKSNFNSTNVNRNVMNLRIGSLPAGMYIISLKDNHGNKALAKFIKE